MVNSEVQTGLIEAWLYCVVVCAVGMFFNKAPLLLICKDAPARGLHQFTLTSSSNIWWSLYLPPARPFYSNRQEEKQHVNASLSIQTINLTKDSSCKIRELLLAVLLSRKLDHKTNERSLFSFVKTISLVEWLYCSMTRNYTYIKYFPLKKLLLDHLVHDWIVFQFSKYELYNLWKDSTR